MLITSVSETIPIICAICVGKEMLCISVSLRLKIIKLIKLISIIIYYAAEKTVDYKLPHVAVF